MDDLGVPPCQETPISVSYRWDFWLTYKGYSTVRWSDTNQIATGDLFSETTSFIVSCMNLPGKPAPFHFKGDVPANHVRYG